MAHFSAVLEHECEQYRDELFELLEGVPCEKESSKDVHWRNSGKKVIEIGL